MSNRDRQEQGSGYIPNPSPSRAPYRRPRPHISQEPIQDDPTRYVTRERYTTLESTRRRHMGTATSDPQYLPETPAPAHDARTRRLRTPAASAGAPAEPGRLHYERYLETPKPGRSIFSARRARAHRQRALIIVIAVALILCVIWFLFLR